MVDNALRYRAQAPLLEAHGLMDRAQALTALLRIDAADAGDGDVTPIQ